MLYKNYNTSVLLPIESLRVVSRDRIIATMDPNPPVSSEPSPSIIRWVLGFLLVGAAWGLTTPFMRRAAVQKGEEKPTPERAFVSDPNTPWMKRKFWGVVYAVLDLLRRPAYAIPLLINLTGSIWFFLLIGQAGRN